MCAVSRGTAVEEILQAHPLRAEAAAHGVDRVRVKEYWKLPVLRTPGMLWESAVESVHRWLAVLRAPTLTKKVDPQKIAIPLLLVPRTPATDQYAELYAK